MDLKDLFVDRELPRDRADLIKRLAEEQNATIREMFEFILSQLEAGVEVEEAVRDRLAPIVRQAGGLPEDLLARHKAQSAHALSEENIAALEALMTLYPEMMEDMTPRLRVITSGPWTRVMLRMAAVREDLFPKMALCMLWTSTPKRERPLLAPYLVGQALDRRDLLPGLRMTASHANVSGHETFAAQIADALEDAALGAWGFQTVHAPVLDDDGDEIGH